MQCQHCRQDLENDWFFCPFCGAPDRREGKPLFNMTDEEISAIYDKMLKTSSEMRGKHPKESPKRSAFGAGVRAQVFEVVVRQAMAGVPWRQICAGPMRVNGISEKEVEDELERRRGGDQRPTAPVPKKPKPAPGGMGIALPSDHDHLSSSQRLTALQAALSTLLEHNGDTDTDQTRIQISLAIIELHAIMISVQQLEQQSSDQD